MKKDPLREEQIVFYQKHYELLFQACMTLRDTRWNFVRFSVVGIFALYATAFYKDSPVRESPWILAFLLLPVVLCLIGFLHAWALRRGITERMSVMREIENRFDVMGWASREKQLTDKHTAGPFRFGPFAYVTYLYWLVMLAISGIIWLLKAYGRI